MTMTGPTKTGDLLQALRRNVESRHTDAEGVEWGYVYLDNVDRQGLSPRAFAARLSHLEQAGEYRRHDSIFGIVRLPREPTGGA